MILRLDDAVTGTKDTLVYRIGEVRDSDTLWGNQTYVYITIAEKTTLVLAPSGSLAPQLGVRSASGALDISYTIPRSGSVEIAVHNILGQEVRTLRLGTQGAGVHGAFDQATLPTGR